MRCSIHIIAKEEKKVVTKYAEGESIEDCGKTGNDETRKPEKKVGCDRNEEHRNQAH